MSVPPDVMQRLAAQQQGQGPSAQPSPQAQGGAPGGAPMTKPEPKDGNKTKARVGVHIAMKILEQLLPMLGAESDEGRTILKTLTTLSKSFGKQDDSDLVPAELLQMFQQLPQMGGGTEVQKQLAQQMSQMKPGAPPNMQRPQMPPMQ